MGARAAISLICIVLHLASAEFNQLFRPIKSGQDVGLVVVPGAFVIPEQYGAVVENIQEASEFALWVYVEDEPTATLIPRRDFVATATGYLQEAGMPEGVPVISIGHSMGGAMMIFELEENPSLVAGLITWGADGFITSENVERFNVPAMTVCGDLDGLTRVTNMAIQFRDLEAMPMDIRLRSPVRTLTGLNHMSYNTGEPPLYPSLRDLPAEIEGEEARRIIAADNAFFIDFCARQRLGEDTTADLEKLGEWFEFQSELYAPILNAMDLELTSDGQVSPWIQEAQRILGATFEPEVSVQNTITDRDGLTASRSDVFRLDDGTVIANTTTSLATQLTWASAQSLESKMSSKEMFDFVLNREPGAEPLPTCRDANIAAWNLVYASISDLARSRYEASGYQVNFKEDAVQFWGPGFILSEMEFSGDGQTLNVTSTSIKTDVGGGSTSGAHYCKLLSPFRVAEFLYIDSLRPNGL